PYMNRDPRFYASIIHDGEMWKGREVEKFIGGIDSPQSDAFAWNSSLTETGLIILLFSSSREYGSSPLIIS
ncbi:unnamed protein product, partial [marine sediment metagenome]